MFQTTYSRDSLGRITSLYETEFGVSKNTDYEYDAVGRLTKVWRNDTLVSQYVYDAFGNLMTVNLPNGDRIDYVVDGQNRRIARKVNGRITNKWLYAGQLTPIAELDSADNIIARFSGGYLNKRDTIYQIITDHLGSPRLVVNVWSSPRKMDKELSLG